MIDYFDVCKSVLSYEQVSDELNLKKRFDYKKYGRMSTLEWLCKQYLHTHVVENFSTVEWKKFRIKTSLLASMVKWIADKDTSFRLLVYFSKNPYEVLHDDYLRENIDEPELFMDECCKLSDKIYHPWQYLRLLLSRGGKYEPMIGDEYLPDLEVAGGAKEKTPLIQFTPGYIIREYRNVLAGRNGVRKYFPTYDYICLKHFNQAVPYNPNILFCDESILEVIFLIRQTLELLLARHVILPDDESTELQLKPFLSIIGLEYNIKLLLSKEENRRLHGKKEPIVKVLLGLCAYLETDQFSQKEEEHISPLCAEIREYIRKHSSNESILSILNECVEAFKQENQKHLEEEQAKEQERKRQVEMASTTKSIHNDRDLRVKRLGEVNAELSANPNVPFTGKTVKWFWIYRRMTDSHVYEHHAYQQFFDELEAAGINTSKINKSLFTDYSDKVKGDFRTEGWTPAEGTEQSTIDRGIKIAEAAGKILFQ